MSGSVAFACFRKSLWSQLRGFDEKLLTNEDYDFNYRARARGEARESRGRYERSSRLLPADIIAKRTETLGKIIGGLTKTIRTIEQRPNRQP